MFTAKNPATSAADLHATRPCHHTSATCWRPEATFKTAKGRVDHVAMHKAAKRAKRADADASTTPAPEAPKLEGKRLEDDRELRGPAGKRAKRTRKTRHEGNVACMNVHTGTHAAWAQADVVAEAEAIVAETPAPTSVDAHLQALALGYVQLSDRIDVIEAQIRVGVTG